MKQLIFGLIILLSGSLNYAQTARVIGYLPTYRFSASNQIEYCKVTHLNLCFGNPDSDGNIVMPSINSVVTDALEKNPDIIIMISLAGAALSTQQENDWSKLIDIPANRPAFIAKIVDYVLSNNLDGVDVDLEWSHVTSGYSDFVVELNAALDEHNKLITVALPNNVLYSNVSVKALDVFDFINIMAYDETGPWRPSNPGQHSSYGYAQKGINFWMSTVGITGDRLNLGLPFYGYDFVNSTTVNALKYSELIATDASYADIDNVGNIYYNGRPTIVSKVELANNQLGGVSIWELGQDSFDEYSLLTAIHNKYTALGVTTTALCGNESTVSVEGLKGPDKIKVYPNPSSNYIRIENLRVHQNYMIYNSIGEKIMEGSILNRKEVDISHLTNGMYLIRLEDGSSVSFIKQ